MQAGTNGSDGDFQYGGDFFIGEFVPEAEFEGFADLWREGVDGSAHVLQGVVVFGFGSGEVWKLFTPGEFGASRGREADVTGDAEEKSTRRGGMGAALGVGEGVDEGLLEEIVGMSGGAEGAVEVTEQGFAMELIKRFDFGHGPSVHSGSPWWGRIADTSHEAGEKFIERNHDGRGAGLKAGTPIGIGRIA